MYRFSSKDRVTVYENPARDLTVVQGNSSVVYPFYKSSGKNSQSDQTWFPWMGYLDHHPEQEKQLYMVKPNTHSLSEETQAIIKKHLGTGSNANTFISRMGNDEALAISCSLGGGEWSRHPGLREEIMSCDATRKYIKSLQVDAVKPMVVTDSKTGGVIPFSGKGCSGEVIENHAMMAIAMESAVAKESAKFVSSYAVQDKKIFPVTDELRDITQLSHARAIRENYLSKLGIFKQQPPTTQPGDELKGGMQFK